MQSAIDVKINIGFDGTVEIKERTRFNYWDLLGVVGGFHDGLFLVFSMFMHIYSKKCFEVEYLNG